ncbi:MAG: hypothetical protein ACJA0H_000052 [Francisellaceae bacterium]
MIKILKNIETRMHVPMLDAQTLTKKEFWNTYVDNNIPCLIKNAIKHWPASTKWRDLDYLKKKCGHNIVSQYPTVNFTGSKEFFSKGILKQKLSDSIDYISTTTDPIVSIPGEPITKNGRFSELRNDIGTFPFLKELSHPIEYPESRFFLYKNAGTGWHSHPVDETLMCQISGTKKVGLFSSLNGNFDQIATLADNEQYFDGSKFLRNMNDELELSIVTVEEGDALYIPSFYWHAVDTIDSSIGITVARCFRSPMHKVGNIRYPQVRRLWRTVLRRPSKLTLLVFIFSLLTITDQILLRIKRFVKRLI